MQYLLNNIKYIPPTAILMSSLGIYQRFIKQQNNNKYVNTYNTRDDTNIFK